MKKLPDMSADIFSFPSGLKESPWLILRGMYVNLLIFVCELQGLLIYFGFSGSAA